MSIHITALYCCLDDFCKVFEEWQKHNLIPSDKKRHREGKLSLAEMLFIMVLFHLSAFRHFKAFYRYGIGHQYRDCFDEIPHYDRFVALMPRLFVPLTVLLHCLRGEQTGIYFADSTKLAVCHNRRSEMGLEHSRHRSPANAIVHILSCLTAYVFRPGKPSIPMINKQIVAYP
ncbi:MAG: hypothetical protein JO185_20870 [Acidobacteriaceae bacterium]|nr:hypothetical protein [Acidobacteriaceae bacterium]